MTIYCQVLNIRELAPNIAELAEPITGKLTTRPWNQYDPANTDWFLSPTTGWPAYPHGKIILKQEHRDWATADLLCAFYLEKGFGADVAQVYPKLKKQGKLLEQTWRWHTFLSALRTGEVDQIASGLADSLPSPLLLEVVAWLPSDPENFDRGGEFSSRWTSAGAVQFRVEPGRLVVQDGEQAKDLLRPLLRCESWRDLAKPLSTKDLDWAWLDLYIGAEVSLGSPAPGAADGSVWSASQLWERVLSPWAGFVR